MTNSTNTQKKETKQENSSYLSKDLEKKPFKFLIFSGLFLLVSRALTSVIPDSTLIHYILVLPVILFSVYITKISFFNITMLSETIYNYFKMGNNEMVITKTYTHLFIIVITLVLIFMIMYHPSVKFILL